MVDLLAVERDARSLDDPPDVGGRDPLVVERGEDAVDALRGDCRQQRPLAD